MKKKTKKNNIVVETKVVERKVFKIKADFQIVQDAYHYGSIDELFFCNECNSLYEWITVSSNGYRCSECYSNDLDIIKNDDKEIVKFFRKKKLEKINGIKFI